MLAGKPIRSSEFLVGVGERLSTKVLTLAGVDAQEKESFLITRLLSRLMRGRGGTRAGDLFVVP